MKLPSLDELISGAARAFRRFPFAILSAGAGAAAAVILIDVNSSQRLAALYDLILAALLGIPLFTALPLVAERRRWPRATSLAVQAAGALVLALYALSLPRDLSAAPGQHMIRFFFLDAGLHFFVAVAPFAGGRETNGFWQYNKSLFLRFLTAALYSSVLFGGLALTMVTANGLLGVPVAGKRYEELWVMIAGVFNTWFFLAGVPGDLDSLESRTEYPAGLRIFTQYVLLSLLAVYLVVLYAYEARILFQWKWPKGWVSGPVIGYSITGVLAMLLLWPMRDRGDRPWVRALATRFHLALFPLLAMLLLSIARRASEYGMTESRYVVAVLGGWLTLISIYFLSSRGKDIRIIPATLCAIAFLTAFGPWGAFGVSRRSQIARLRHLLESNHVLAGGAIRKPDREPPFEDLKQISAAVSYLNDVHDLRAVRAWLGGSGPGGRPAGGDSLARASRYERAQLAVRLMGLSFVENWQESGKPWFEINMNRQAAIPLDGYQHLIPSMSFWLGQTTQTGEVEAGGARYSVVWRPDSSDLIIARRDSSHDSLRVELSPRIKALLEENRQRAYIPNLPPEKVAVEGSAGDLRVRVYILSLNGKTDGAAPNRMEIALLLGRRPK
ncbi:MAG TPA: DUF4153 domain-containing protein [Candidatus Eisenbacteria bacterium]|jgi:hypothetical protein